MAKFRSEHHLPLTANPRCWLAWLFKKPTWHYALVSGGTHCFACFMEEGDPRWAR